MGIKVKISHSIENLANELGAECRKIQSDIFNTLYFVTQTKGLSNWLKLQLAKENKILANYKLNRPEEIINFIFFLVQGKKQRRVPVSNYKWAIFIELNASDFISTFPTTAAYYQNDSIKRYLLAVKIADLFDQYDGYRPKLFENWLNDSFLFTKDEDEKWQSYLWKKCNIYLEQKYKTGHQNLIELEQLLQIPSNQRILAEKIKSLFLIGLNSITQNQWNFFGVISRYIPVQIYFLDPSAETSWLDESLEKKIEKLSNVNKRIHTGKSNNEFLKGYGTIIQNNYQSLLKIAQSDTEIIIHTQEKKKPQSLLEKVQDDIILNKSGESRNTIKATDLTDESVVVNACYNIQREVECLYNFICKKIEVKKISSVHSILINVRDLDLYAPYIESVFDNGTYKLPYLLNGRKIQNENSLSKAFLSIINLNRNDFNSIALINILQDKTIQNRFGIKNIQIIEEAIQRAGMKFDFEGNPEIETQYVSFQNGIQRLLLGYCIPDSNEIHFLQESYHPVEITDGQDIHEIFSFCHFLEVLNSNLNIRLEKKSINEWLDYAYLTLKDFILDENEIEIEELRELQEELERIRYASVFLNEEIEFEIFRKELQKRFSEEETSGFKIGGGIVFGNYIPMRSVPYEYIAMLGLNFQDFPRKNKNQKFNLLFKYPKEGDRELKNNDKHLFLETLLSAKKGIYLSYIGKGDGDNSTLLPSSVLEDLIEYIETPFKKKNKITQVQPLHPYSQKYNSSDHPQLYSYLGNFKGNLPSENPMEANDRKFENEIELSALISFFKNPFKYFYNKKLGIYYEENTPSFEKNELFELDTLLIWKLKNETLKLKPEEIEVYRKKLILNAEYPLQNLSKVKLETVYQEIENTRKLFLELSKEKAEEYFDLKIQLNKNLTIKGRITGIYGEKQITVCYSKSSYKNMVDATIAHLALCASEKIYSSYFILQPKDLVIPLNYIDKSTAKSDLITLLNFYYSANEHPFPYYNSIYGAPKCWKKDGNTFELFQKAIDDYKYPLQDPYLIKEFQQGYFQDPQIIKKYMENCLQIHEIVKKVFPRIE